MQIKQAANSWQQLTGPLLHNAEKSLFIGHRKQKIHEGKAKIHFRINENGFLKNYRDDPNPILANLILCVRVSLSHYKKINFRERTVQ